ncbi:MAG: autotransporter-associated beta strand repeat-containing protein [Kiritimatiellae bacterium]|nr:autotransporter-associated beta strand repeat-containing protein [Kiritimatiellia bacterium]
MNIAGPGTVKLNPSNTHAGGTTLSGGTLILSGDIPASGPSPVGSGTFTVSGGTLRGTGSFGGNITGTGAASVAGDGTLTLSGSNNFQSGVAISEGVVEVSGGTVTSGSRIDLGTVSGKSATLRVSGGAITGGGGNFQRGYAANTESVLVMTGGTFDVGGKNSVVGYNGGPVTARTDIAGTASLRNIGNFYIHASGGASSVNEISVHDGGTFGFASLYDGASAFTTLSVDGGTLANDSSGTSAFNWIRETVSSFSVGDGGVTFSGTPGSAVVAQIRKAMQAASGSSGTAAGVTFDGGAWGYYVAGNAYSGPTTLKNQSKLFLYADGTIPSGSVVTIKAGSILSNGGAAKTVSSLVLEDDAILGFGSSANALTVSGSIELPSRAKIALYNSDNPSTTAKNTNGSYAILKVPASYAAALRAVSWSCATATSGKSYTFSVATSGDTATLSMTIAAASIAYPLAVSGDMALVDTLDISGDITIGSGATLAASPIYGTATGGSITINNGGTLDASAGNIRPVNASGNSFHLYLNEGGTLIVNQIHGSDNATIQGEATGTPMFHFNGGTIYPVAFEAVDGNRFLANYQTAVVGANGVTVDLNRWIRPDGYTTWTRCSIQGKFNHDPNCAGSDGGITVRGINGEERSVVLFGSRFGGSTLNGGIHVEDGAAVAVHASALVGQTIELAPGSRFRPYNNTSTIQIGNLTLGEQGTMEPVAFDGSSNRALYNVVVSGTLSVLSPVEFSVTSDWNVDSTLSSGTYTALVYQASCSVNPSLFRLPANAPSGATLSAEEVTLTAGDYAGCKALVVTIANDIVVTGSTLHPTPLTVSENAAVGSIVVGGAWNGEADPVCETSLTISGNVTASEGLYLGYNPAPGVDKDDWHKGFLTLNGGSITTPHLYSIYRPGMTGSNDSDCRFGCEATVNDGLLDVAGDVRLGYNRSKNGDNLYSRLTVNNGRVAVGGKFYLLYDDTQGAFTAPGSIVLNGGEVDVKGVIDMSRNAQNPSGNQAYNTKFGIWLNGGVLKAENIMMTAASATTPQVVFNGGVYAPYGAKAANRTMSYPNEVYVSAGGAVISTENIPAGKVYTVSQALKTDPAISGTVDGGLVKRGAGTLELSGANTFTGPVRVEEGTLVASSADALSDSIAVADGAVLDLGASTVTVGSAAASGAVVGSLVVTNAILATSNGSFLSVEGNLEIRPRTSVIFGSGATIPDDWSAIAAASGTITAPGSLRLRSSGGEKTRVETKVEGGVLYARASLAGCLILVR